MKRFLIDNQNVLFLDAEHTNKSGLSVTVSIVGEDGSVLKDADGAALKDVALVFDDTNHKYALDPLTFQEGTKPQFARLYWIVKEGDSRLELAAPFSPEDVELAEAAGSGDAEVMPITMFVDSFIASESKLDGDYKRAAEAYVNANPDNVRRELRAAQGNIEQKIKMKLFKAQAKMDRDYYLQDFRAEFWMQQTDFRPIVSVDSYILQYGAKGVNITNDIAEHVVIEKKMGTIEFLPTALSGSLFVALLNNLAGLGVSIMQDAGYSRVPLLFRILYTHGLDFPNLPTGQKESIRQAVGRNALINLLPRIDPLARKPSQSQALDGATRSRTGGVRDLIKDYREEEAEWVKEIMREYGMHFDLAVV
jgi:hypothetical protein